MRDKQAALKSPCGGKAEVCSIFYGRIGMLRSRTFLRLALGVFKRAAQGRIFQYPVRPLF
jgi:hypothetical protein